MKGLPEPWLYFFLLALPMLGAGCAGGDSMPVVAGATTTQTTAPGAFQMPPGEFQPKVEVVATQLTVPWALAFATRLPAASQQVGAGPYLFVTERPGRIRLVAGGKLRQDPVAVLPVAAVDEAGLLGLALDPRFEQNGNLYVMYTYQGKSGLRNRIARLTLQGAIAGGEKVLLEDIPAASIHDGGRLKIGPDGKLYVTTGTTQGDVAQRVDSPAGKILRLNLDGTVPADNPFRGSPVYSYGHRNPQGLAWQPGTGQLFSTEHGPSAGIDGSRCCHDELNRIVRGGNYGWPTVAGLARDARFVDPVLESGGDTWAPGGMAFYDGTLLAPWRGSLFFGTLRGRHLHRVVLGGTGLEQVIWQERLFDGAYGRIRDVVAGPDGALYFTTSNRDFRWAPGPDDDRILRVVPG